VPYPDDTRSGEFRPLPRALIPAAVREVDSADYTPPEQSLQQARSSSLSAGACRTRRVSWPRLAGLLGAGRRATARPAARLGGRQSYDRADGRGGRAALYVALGIRATPNTLACPPASWSLR
jgi:hypothetical protein